MKKWFDLWRKGDFLNLTVGENLKHTSPFGKIEDKRAYIDLVNENKEKNLGYVFEFYDGIYENQSACVRSTAKQLEGFTFDVCEWFYLKDNLIEEVIAYYHIGEVQEERKLKDS